MKKSMLIYPFTRDVISIIRHSMLLKDYEKVYCVCLPADKRENEDLSYFDNGIYVNCICDSDFVNSINNVDDVYLTTDTDNDYVRNEYRKLIDLCCKKKKNIGFLYRISISDCQKMQEICKSHDIELFQFTDTQFQNKKNILESISVPVIFVCGSAKDTDKFETQLIVRQKLIELGYKVSQIGTKYYSGLFGFHSIPEYMYDGAMTETEKILCFNNQVKKMEEEEKPDIIIIGIPGGIIRESERYLLDFAIPAYEISAAITPDYTIMNIYENEYDADYLLEVVSILNHRYEFEINQIVVSNTYLDYAKTNETGEKEILKLPYKEVKKKIEDINIDNVVANSIYEDSDMVVSNIISNLSENTEDISL